MPLLQLTTRINAPQQIVFDLARDIDFHQRSTAHTREKAIAGKTSGLIQLGESVTWEAVHFGVKQQLTSKITAMNPPHSFTDEMVKGAFKSFKHEHLFYRETASYSTGSDYTIMIDNFHFEAPLGILGKVANVLFLRRYMSQLLHKRNLLLKEEAERL